MLRGCCCPFLAHDEKNSWPPLRSTRGGASNAPMVCGFSHPYLVAPVRGGGAGVCLLSEPAPPHMAPPGSGNGGGMRRPAHGAAGLLSRYDRYGQQPGAGGPVYRGLSHPDRHLLVCLPGELLDRAVCGLLRLHRPGPGRDAEDGAQADPCRQRAVPGPPGYPGGRPAGILWLLCRTVFIFRPFTRNREENFGNREKAVFSFVVLLFCLGMARLAQGNPDRNQTAVFAEGLYQILCDLFILLLQFGVMEWARLSRSVGRHAGAGPPATRAVPPVQGKHGSGQRKIPRPEKICWRAFRAAFPRSRSTC